MSDEKTKTNDQGEGTGAKEAGEASPEAQVKFLTGQLEAANKKIGKLEKKLEGKDKGIKGMQTQIANLKEKVKQGGVKKMTLIEH